MYPVKTFAMKNIFTLTVSTLIITFFTMSGKAQISVQSSKITIEIKTINQNDVAINGTSKEAEAQIDPMQNKSTITLDPTSIQSDNVEFDKAIEAAGFDAFVLEVKIDPLELNYSSKKKEPIYAQCKAVINGITGTVPITLTAATQMTNETHTYLVTGNGKISLSDFNLTEPLPMLKDDIKFRFTQNIIAEFR